MFAPISAVLGLFFFTSTLPNGIRVDELPAGTDSVEIVAGYAAGGLTGLESTGAATALLRDAYAAGGDIQFINEIDRTAVRIVAPAWAAPMLFERLPALFKEVPEENGDGVGKMVSVPSLQRESSDSKPPLSRGGTDTVFPTPSPFSPDFLEKVEQEIRDEIGRAHV